MIALSIELAIVIAILAWGAASFVQISSAQSMAEGFFIVVANHLSLCFCFSVELIGLLRSASDDQQQSYC